MSEDTIWTTVSYITENGDLLSSVMELLKFAKEYQPGMTAQVGHDGREMLITEVHVKGGIKLRGAMRGYPEALFAPPQVWVVVEDKL